MASIAVVGAHPDDQEIGMGATIAALAEQGHDVLLIDVTDGSPTPRGDRASRLEEARAACAALQPSPEAAARGGRVSRVLLDLPNRRVEHTLETRHAIAGAYRAHQASIIFIPMGEDAHPDHRAVHHSAWDARFDAKLTKVEMPAPAGMTPGRPPIYPRWMFLYDVSHLRGVKEPDFCLDVTGFERKKQAAVRAYRSQFGPWDGGTSIPNDPYALVRPEFPDRLVQITAMWGSTIGVPHAEPFWSPEPIGLRGLEGLTG